MRSAVIAAIAVLALGGTAYADVVPPPEEDCPKGAKDAITHSGHYCAPHKCTRNDTCPQGTECGDMALCIGSKFCGGMMAPGEKPSDCQVTTTSGPCPADRKCPVDETCQDLRICVDPSQVVDDDGGGCNPAAPALPAVGILVSLLALGLLRRRRG